MMYVMDFYTIINLETVVRFCNNYLKKSFQ